MGFSVHYVVRSYFTSSFKFFLSQNVHTDWVNKLEYVHLTQGYDCSISISSTDNDSMYLADLANITYIKKHPGFVKCPSNRFDFENKL